MKIFKTLRFYNNVFTYFMPRPITATIVSFQQGLANFVLSYLVNLLLVGWFDCSLLDWIRQNKLTELWIVCHDRINFVCLVIHFCDRVLAGDKIMCNPLCLRMQDRKIHFESQSCLRHIVSQDITLQEFLCFVLEQNSPLQGDCVVSDLGLHCCVTFFCLFVSYSVERTYDFVR